jgi:hypothetical protein
MRFDVNIDEDVSRVARGGGWCNLGNRCALAVVPVHGSEGRMVDEPSAGHT